MATATPLVIPQQSQDAIVQFERNCFGAMSQQWNLRSYMENIDKAYARELTDLTEDHQKSKRANSYGDSTKFQNVVVPVVMPQVEAAVTYQSSVFLTGHPIFGWVAAPDHEDAALQYQAIIEENSIRGGWAQQLMIAFRDAFKYNLAACEVDWGREVTAAIETDIGFGAEGKPKEVVWQGNRIKRWDLYNSFWDTRYNPTDLYKDGEFAGTTKLMSRVHLKKFINELPDKIITNVRAAFESGGGVVGSGTAPMQGYYIPTVNPEASIQQASSGSPNWMAWAGLLDRPAGEINYKDFYEVTTLYARIIPQDFRLRVPSANTPQVWKFIIVNHQVLIYAERQTNAHNHIPVFFMQPNEDGLGYQTKSLAKNAQPFQEIASALVNSAMAARRRAISDRGIYNPMLISEQHINNPSPTAKIPLRPAGYGKPPSEAYYPIPYKDDQSAVAFQELPQILQMANTVNGLNQAKQGQFVKGNKTMHEFSTVMANANGRDQITSILLESQFFTPVKEVIKINTLQYQQSTTVFSQSRQEAVKIDPLALRNSYNSFKITDGLTPTDKVISADEFAVALQTIASSPQIGGAYNIGPMFSYLMKTRNVELAAFEKSPAQQAYEQAVSAWSQTVQMLAKQMGDNIDPSKYPPQPKPQDFGYTPGASPNQQGQSPGAANLNQSGAANG